MRNSMLQAIIRKDIRSVVTNKRLFPVLLIVPLVFTVVLPSVFILAMHFSPDSGNDLQQLLELFPSMEQSGDRNFSLVSLVLNQIMPTFFMMIPIMAASVMAASSFVGEKEKSTLETLLYCPLSLKQIFQAKILSSFLVSMLVSAFSFLIMILVVEVETRLLLGRFLLPSLSWLIIMLLLSPAITLIAVTLIVRGSAKAQTVEESQQHAVFLVLPIVLLLAGQFTGIIFISGWFLAGLAVVLVLLAFLLLKNAFRQFHYEKLLQ